MGNDPKRVAGTVNMDFPTKWLPDRLKGKAHTAIEDLIEALKGLFNPKPLWVPRPLAIPRPSRNS